MAKRKKSKCPVQALLNEVGATLLRSKRHEVWKLPNGKRFVMASTPGDKRTVMNCLKTLKRALGQ